MEAIGPLSVALLKLQLDNLRSSHELVEAALRLHHKSIDEWYEEQRMIVDEDEIEEDAEYLEQLLLEQREEADEAYPWILRASLLGVGYGIVEYFLTTVCKQAQHDLVGPKLSDLRGEGITRAALFLRKVVRMNFPNTTEWQDLTTYGILRNIALHAQGEVAEHVKLEPIRALQIRKASFSIDEVESRLRFEKDFIPQFIETAETFADQFEEAWRDPRVG